MTPAPIFIVLSRTDICCRSRQRPRNATVSEVLQIFGDPKPHVCRSGNQDSVGVRFVPGRQFVGGLGCECQGVLLQFRHLSPNPAQPARLQPRPPARSAHNRCSGTGYPPKHHRGPSGHSNAHRPSRRQTPACRNPHCDSVMVDHSLLNGMQSTIRAGDTLDGPHGFAVKLWQEKNAGVQGRAHRCRRSPSQCKRHNRLRCSLLLCQSGHAFRATNPAKWLSKALRPRQFPRSEKT